MSTVIEPRPNLTAPQANRLYQQAKELEGVFLNTLVKEMFAGIDTDGAFGGGFAEETWRGMQAEQLSAAMADAGGIGLADQIVGDLLRYQEAAQDQNNQITPGAYN